MYIFRNDDGSVTGKSEEFEKCYREECPFFYLQNGKNAFCRRVEADSKVGEAK